MFNRNTSQAVLSLIVTAVLLATISTVCSAEDEIILSKAAHGRYIPGSFGENGWPLVGQGQAGWISFPISDLGGLHICGLDLSFTLLDIGNAWNFPLTTNVYDVSTAENRLFLTWNPMTEESEAIAADLHSGSVFATFQAVAELWRIHEMELNDLAVSDLRRRLELDELYFSIGLATENFHETGYFAPAFATLHVLVNCVLPVVVDIAPGSDTNNISIRSRGLIRVAILSTSEADGDAVDFDARSVDPDSLALGPSHAGVVPPGYRLSDEDDDGDIDMVAFFAVQELDLACGDESLELTGETLDGVAITGSDSIRVRGCR
jgi:hypothetical protein